MNRILKKKKNHSFCQLRRFLKLRCVTPEAVKAKGGEQIERKKAGEQELVQITVLHSSRGKSRCVARCREHEPQDSSLTTLLDLLEILSSCGAFCHNGI